MGPNGIRPPRDWEDTKMDTAAGTATRDTAARRKTADTREQILRAAERGVLQKGFAGTSIDELIAEVGITKSGFFYHFKDKSALAKALLQRYLDDERVMLDELFDRAFELHEDPLHGFLVGMKMFEEIMSDLPTTHPGCMVASVCYQDQLFNQDVRDLNRSGVLEWRRRFRETLDRIAAIYPPKIQVDLDDLADMFSSTVDGGIIISKATGEIGVLPGQVRLVREFIRVIFLGTPSDAGSAKTH